MPARKLKIIWSTPKEKEQIYFRYDPYGNRLARIGCCPPPVHEQEFLNQFRFLVVDVNEPLSSYPADKNYFGVDLGSAPPYLKFALGPSAENIGWWISNMVNTATKISVGDAVIDPMNLNYAIYNVDFVISSTETSWFVSVSLDDSHGSFTPGQQVDITFW